MVSQIDRKLILSSRCLKRDCHLTEDFLSSVLLRKL